MTDTSSYPPYSVLMSVYFKEKAEYLEQALDSMWGQTVTPSEVVIVEDGPLTEELYAVLDAFQSRYGDAFVRLKNETNLGLGRALNKGLAACKNELVARMDTDDISAVYRCERQLAYFQSHDVDIVGSNIAEFIEDPKHIVSIRKVPTGHEEIVCYMRKRCPMNHMSVMFKKSAVTAVSGYQDWHFNEDYYLWLRMFLGGATFGNIDENLVLVRVGNDMYARRGGYKYYKSERNLFKFMRKNKIIGYGAYVKAKTIRFILYVLMPNKMRAWAYKKFARS